MAAATQDPDAVAAEPVDDAAVEPQCTHCGLVVPRSRRGGGSGPWFCCFGCRFAYGLAKPGGGVSGKGETGGGRVVAGVGTGTLLLRTGLGVFLAMNTMVFSWAFYSREWYAQGAGRHDALAGLFAYLLMLMCTGLIVTLGLPLAVDAWGQLVDAQPDGEDGARRVPNKGGWRACWIWFLRSMGRVRFGINALVCVGVGAAYAISVVHTFRGQGSLYYDTAAMILVLVTLGCYLEAAAKRKAAGVTRVVGDVPAGKARVRRDGRETEMHTDDLRVGDRVFVRAGDCVAADGVVEEGTSRVDEASLTGESRSRTVGSGESVLAGTTNLDGALWVKALRVGDNRVISRTRALLESARLKRLPIQRLADRVANVFVPSVMALALGVAGWHAVGGDVARGLLDALCVLLISCPCALGLAAPLGAWSALRRAAEHGVVIDSAATLERIAGIDRVFFDKTGTLTTGELRVVRTLTAEGVGPEETLRWAAALDATTVHPIAESLVREVKRIGGDLPEVEGARTVAGMGVSGRIRGKQIYLGSLAFAREHGLDVRRFRSGRGPHTEGIEAASPHMSVYLFDSDRVLACFEMEEHLREGAAAAIQELQRMGVAAEMLTGDQSDHASKLAEGLSIPFRACQLPEDKLSCVLDARGRGERVAMVGDGVNDGPVLGGADVGFVMSGGSGLAKRAGHVWLLSDRLERVPATISIARHCMKRVRLNLVWAFGYNMVGLALAVCGQLTPVVSALAMIASSLTIITSSKGAGRVVAGGGGEQAVLSHGSNAAGVQASDLKNAVVRGSLDVEPLTVPQV